MPIRATTPPASDDLAEPLSLMAEDAYCEDWMTQDLAIAWHCFNASRSAAVRDGAFQTAIQYSPSVTRPDTIAL
jgi:hypothetical protein